jgi:hypothetical protein
MTGSCLVLFVSWVDDFLVMGHPEDVQKVEDDISGAFGAKSEVELKEYVCCNIDSTHREADGLRTIKITQPVLVQELEDEFYLPLGKASSTPAVDGQVLVWGDGTGAFEDAAVTKYRSRTAISMFMMQ